MRDGVQKEKLFKAKALASRVGMERFGRKVFFETGLCVSSIAVHGSIVL